MSLVIREAAAGDTDDLADISRNTWEGHDYLEQVSKNWLADGGFIVGEAGGRVVACAKITGMPGRIAWLEGLRVHPDFRGRGYGRIMSDQVLQLALEKVETGEFSAVEFSTYIGNVESRTMAEKQGFRITERFHVIGMENPLPSGESVSLKETALSSGDLSIYPEHTPCGWKYIHTSAADTPGWLRRHAQFWQTESGAGFLTSGRGGEVSPLATALDDPEGFITGAQSLAVLKGLDYLEMMIHDSHRNLLKHALEAGFSYWEEPGAANIPLYRYYGTCIPSGKQVSN